MFFIILKQCSGSDSSHKRDERENTDLLYYTTYLKTIYIIVTKYEAKNRKGIQKCGIVVYANYGSKCRQNFQC